MRTVLAGTLGVGVVALMAALLAAACGSSGASSKPCSGDADCSADELCGFPYSDGCEAKGTCVPASGICDNLCYPHRTCDGTCVEICDCNSNLLALPDDYAPMPVAGSCVPDGGS